MPYKKIVENSISFLQLNDYDTVLETILTETKQFLNADAGTIYIAEDGNLIFQYTQNDTLQFKRSEVSALKYSNKKIKIDDSSIAGYSAHYLQTLNIPDAYNLNPALPFKFNKNFDKTSGYKTISILTSPITNSANKLLGVIQVINKKDTYGKIIPFSEDDEKIIIKYFGIQSGIAIQRAKLTSEIIYRMVRMAELRDPKETGSHVKRVSNYSAVIYRNLSEQMGLNQKEITKNIDIIKSASLLHDVGKVGIPDAILKKSGKLSEDEYKYMKMHTVFGAKLFDNTSEPLDIASKDIALNHHERWDGKGYPGDIDITNAQINDISAKPKKGEEIPLFARIVAVADVFDALTSNRSYKNSWTFEDSVNEINRNSGTQFDPLIVRIFNDSLSEIKNILEYYL